MAGCSPLKERMLRGSSFYRDNTNLACMGHLDCRRPCRYEPDWSILHAAKRAQAKGVLSDGDYRCIELDIMGYPGKVIIGYAGQDPTGALSKRAKYACERAYSKIGRRLCELCQMLWAFDRPKGPRLDADLHLKYQREEWRTVRARQTGRSLRLRRPGGIRTIREDDGFISPSGT